MPLLAPGRSIKMAESWPDWNLPHDEIADGLTQISTFCMFNEINLDILDNEYQGNIILLIEISTKNALSSFWRLSRWGPIL